MVVAVKRKYAVASRRVFYLPMRAKAIACLFAKCASILSGAPAHADGWNWSDIRRFHIAGMRIIDPRDVYLFSIRLQPTLGVNVGDIVLFTE